MSHIFISYNHEDNDFSEILSHKLHDSGFSTWRDVDMLRAGEVWRVEIDQAIKDSFAMIVVMTPEAKISEYVTYEWAFALGVGVRIMPIMLRRIELHPRLQDIQFLDFTGRVRPWLELVDTVQAIASNNNSLVLIPRNTPPYIKKAIDALNNPNPADREGAIAILVKDRHHPIVQKAVEIALKHDLRDVRIQTSFSIAKFKDMRNQALPGLLEALHNNQYSTMAAEALGKLGELAIPGLLDALNDKNSWVRSNAVMALGLIKDIAAIPALHKALDDTNTQVRINAITALGMLKDVTVTPKLFELVNNGKEVYDIRSSAVTALNHIGDTSAALSLLEAAHQINNELSAIKNSIEALRKNVIDRRTNIELKEAENREHEIEHFLYSIIGQLIDFHEEAFSFVGLNLHNSKCRVCSIITEEKDKHDFF
jgi:HEAT repeat protein